MSKKNEVTTIEPTQPAVAEVQPAQAQASTSALSGEVLKPLPPIPPKGERQHKATFASDNLKGGYMIRIEGPNSAKFAKREVPVERFDGSETVCKCDKLVWTGTDTKTGRPVTLYKFVAHPRAAKDDGVAF